MKKHTVKTKLTLTAETIRSLQLHELAAVAGAGASDACLTTTLTGATSTYKSHK